MSRRPPETLADYLVVAISPALIMLLVGSLVFFLIDVFYRGDYPLRLTFVMAMFVLGIVCIARIAMEEGSGYASLFGLPLAVLVAIALMRFVPGSTILSLGLMALIWWAAHKLTWDCTLIDDSVDASGEGLLAHMGLEPGRHGEASQPEAATGPAEPEYTGPEWWRKYEKYFGPDRRPHTPGVWVVYFSLAALPIFGIGGWFIGDDLETRRRTFWVMVVYVGSGLGLLLATSFLSLRKYLRQRRLEMPAQMAATWVGVGLVMILATLLLASLLPRPNPEYSVAHLLPDNSGDLQANWFGFGPEGAEESPENPSQSATDAREGQETERVGETVPQSKDGASEQPGQKSRSQPSQGQQDGGEQTGGDKSGQHQGGKSGDGQQSSGDSNKQQQSSASEQGKSESSTGESSESGKEKSNDANQSQDSKGKGGSESKSKMADRKGSNDNESSSDQNSSGQSSQDVQQSSSSTTGEHSSSQPQSQPSSPPGSSQPNLGRTLSQALGSVGTALKWLFYLVLAAVLAFLAWKYRAQLLEAWKKLLAELRELFAWLRGGKKTTITEELSQPVALPTSFASFSDPFETGQATRWPLAELVRYTYAALEAWGREHGCPRTIGQTPHEYASAISGIHPEIAEETRYLADLYSHVAFAPGSLRSANVDPLRSLWRKMQAPALVAAVV